MRLPLPISLSLLLFAAQKVCAQLAPADDFFHSGAQFYLSNNIAGAKQAVANGLKFYPDDDKLKKLDELLKQQNQSQSQQNQQSQAKQDQQKQDQKDQAEKSSDQKKEDGQKQPEQPKSASENKGGEKPENKNADGQPVAPGQMTPEEA